MWTHNYIEMLGQTKIVSILEVNEETLIGYNKPIFVYAMIVANGVYW